MAFNTKLNLIDAKFFQCIAGTLALSGSTSVGTAQYLTDKSSTYVARSIPDVAYVTGQSANLQSQIDYVSGVTDQNSSDIVYLSGETDLRLLISDFNTYSGATDTTLTGLRTDVDTVSGLTETNATDIAFITGLAITGASKGLTKSGQDVLWGGTLDSSAAIAADGNDIYLGKNASKANLVQINAEVAGTSS